MKMFPCHSHFKTTHRPYFRVTEAIRPGNDASLTPFGRGTQPHFLEKVPFSQDAYFSHFLATFPTNPAEQTRKNFTSPSGKWRKSHSKSSQHRTQASKSVRRRARLTPRAKEKKTVGTHAHTRTSRTFNEASSFPSKTHAHTHKMPVNGSTLFKFQPSNSGWFTIN